MLWTMWTWVCTHAARVVARARCAIAAPPFRSGAAPPRRVGIIYYYNSGPDATCQVDGREPADEQARSAVRPVDGSRFNFCDYSTPSGYTGPLLPHLCHCAEWPVHSGAAPTAVAWLRARARREACQHPWATARHAGRATRARGAAEGARSGRDQAGCEPSLPRGLAPLSFTKRRPRRRTRRAESMTEASAGSNHWQHELAEVWQRGRGDRVVHDRRHDSVAKSVVVVIVFSI